MRSGAALDESRQERLREINKEEALLTLQYSDNVLKETNDYRLVIDKEEDLSGLPQTVVEAATEAAAGAGLEGKWVFTLHNPSRLPFYNTPTIANFVKRYSKLTTCGATTTTKPTIKK